VGRHLPGHQVPVEWVVLAIERTRGWEAAADVAEVRFWWAGVRLGAVLRGVGFVLENGHLFT